MDSVALHALSPLDGRYESKTSELREYFSEYALIRYRLIVEVEYFIALCELPLPQLSDFPKASFDDLRALYQDFDDTQALLIKAVEKQTNHDVKSVEYYLRDKFAELGLERYAEFVHFGLTSQDINNTAFPCMLKDAIKQVYYPQLLDLLQRLDALVEAWSSVPMLARTHGQPASPTVLGKEIGVYTSRLRVQLQQLRSIPASAKFGGATGNFNAHHAAYPSVDWEMFANHFVNDRLGLTRSEVTTQIDNYDNLAAIFDALRRINTILVDFARDMWMYISMDYFRQTIVANEVGSSAMPHKVNPIDFENAEGNLGIANAVFEHLASKLPVSRLQRDLTDSTVIRNIGVPLGHTLIALLSLKKGLGRISLHREVIDRDLEMHWEVVAEGFQVILRREGVAGAYEILKGLSRREVRPNRETLTAFIDSLDVRPEVKEELRALTPFTYIGILPHALSSEHEK